MGLHGVKMSFFIKYCQPQNAKTTISNYCLIVFYISFLILSMLYVADSYGSTTIQISQNIPTAYKNDQNGQEYEIVLTNLDPDNFSENMTIEIEIPDEFTYIADSMTNSLGLTMVVSDEDQILVTLSPNEIIETSSELVIQYRLKTSCDVILGRHPFKVNVNTNENTESNTGVVTVKTGLIIVDIATEPEYVMVEDIVEVTVEISNTGEGTLFSIDFWSQWGTGFIEPELLDGNLTPEINGQKFQILIDALPGGESRFFKYQVKVNECENLELDVGAIDPCEPDITYRDDDSPKVVLMQPNIKVSAEKATIQYCGKGTIKINVMNVDEPAGTRGAASNLKLNAIIPSNVTISNITNGWTYDNEVFSYENGFIQAGETQVLEFDLNPHANCTEPSGTIIINPVHENACGDPFTPPGTLASYGSEAPPEISLNLTGTAVGEDNYRIFLGEQIVFTITPALTFPEKWQDNIIITDTIPDTFTIVDIHTAAGIFDRTDNTLTWTLTPHEAELSPALTITTTASNDPCDSGQHISNSASIADVSTSCGCIMNASDSESFFLQSKGHTDIGESRQINNLPEQGGFDVCESSQVEYIVQYEFHDDNGVWTGTEFIDHLDGYQVYVQDSFMIDIGFGYMQLPGNYIIATSPLKVDLTYLNTIYSNDTIANKNLSLKYSLLITPESLEACNPSGEILSRSQINIADGGIGCGDSTKSLHKAVKVPIYRAAMSIGVSLGTDTISKGENINVSVNVNKQTVSFTDQVVITVDTSNYAYLGNPTYSGFDNQIPTIDIQENQIVFQFNDPLNESGTIQFEAVKNCTDNYDISGQLTFKDRCGITCTSSDSDSPVFKVQGDIHLNLTPQQVLASRSDLYFIAYITNKGNGTAFNVMLEEKLSDVLTFVSSQVDDVEFSPEIEYNPEFITWNLGSLLPNEMKTVQIFLNTTGDECDFLNASTTTIKQGWIDINNAYQECETEEKQNGPQFTMPPSNLDLYNILSQNTQLCGTGNIQLRLKNTGMTHNYNMVVTQKLQNTGLILIPGSVQIDGQPTSDPLISGTDLTWTYDESQSHYIPELKDIDMGQIHIISFDVQSGEQFNADHVISSLANWQKPCERGDGPGSGYVAGVSFTVPVDRPIITLEKTGWNTSANETEIQASDIVFGGLDDIVIWKIYISNSGNATAGSAILRDTFTQNIELLEWDDHTEFSSPSALNGTSDELLDIPDIPAKGSISIYIKGKILDLCTNETGIAAVEWGCTNDGDKGGLTSPEDNDDTAQIKSIPVLNVTQQIVDLDETSSLNTNGIVTITIENTGGTARNIVLTDILPTGFALDPTFQPVVSSTQGNLNVIQKSGTETNPVFSIYKDLTSILSNDPQTNILRNNEMVSLTFHIVQIASLDTTFDKTVRTESTSNNFDPQAPVNSSNSLELIFENTCGNQQTPVSSSISISPKTPDLDVNILNPFTRLVNTVGDSEQFRVQVRNNGEDVANNGILSVNIGAGWRGNVPSGCTGLIPGTVQCAIDGLNSRQNKRINFDLELDNLTNPLFVIAEIEGNILYSDGTDTDGNYSLDLIQTRVIGFNLTKTLVQTTQDITADTDVIIGEDATFAVEAFFFGLSAEDVITDIIITETVPQGAGFISQEVVSTPGNAGTSEITLPQQFESGTIQWTLNQFNTSGNFGANVHTRILNQALNQEAEPNVHGSVITDLVDAEFKFQDSRYYNDTTGFPALTNRQVSLEVQTPNISITKSVRNVTQNYPNSGNYLDTVSAHAGDILEYQLVINNISDSVTGYDLVISNQLSDKLFLRPVSTDGIDNNGNAQIDEANEGNDNGGGPGAEIVFTSLHQSSLSAFNADTSLVLKYQVKVENSANPDETIQSTVRLSYDTLPGESGSQKTPQTVSGLESGARLYERTDAISISITPIDTTKSKTIISTSHTTLGGTSPFEGPQDVVIGEIIQYRLKFSVVPSTMNNWIITDNLPQGLKCTEATPLTLSAGFTPGGIIIPEILQNGSSVKWDIQDQELAHETGVQEISVFFMAIVDNITANQSGTDLVNQDATVSYLLNESLNTISLDDLTVIVKEPDLSIAHTFPSGNYDAGDIITFSIDLWHTNTSNSDAYDVSLTTLIPEGMTYVPDSMNVPSGINSNLDDHLGDQLEWKFDSINLTYNQTNHLELTYQVTIDNTVEPDQELNNSSNLSWTSLPGNQTGERTGDDGQGLLNDYSQNSSCLLTVHNPIELIKTNVENQSKFTIGETLSYEVNINILEGIINNCTMFDTLPQGTTLMQASITNGNNNISYVLTNVPSPGDSGALNWNFGTITNTPNGNSSDDFIKISYQIRINDVIENKQGLSRTNQAYLSYIDASETERRTDISSHTFDICEPELIISKSLSTGQDYFVDPGEDIFYRLVITNEGDSPAYNMYIRDILPQGMRSQSPQVQQLTIGGISVSDISPVIDLNAGTIVWYFPDEHPLNPNESVVIDISATLDAFSPEGKEYINQAVVDTYFSRQSTESIKRIYSPTTIASAGVSTLGITWHPDHQQTTQAGTSIVYPHQFEAKLGTGTGTLNFSVSSSKNLIWVIYEDTNSNGMLDSSDQQWTQNSQVTSSKKLFFIKGYIPDTALYGWQDTTIITAILSSGSKTFERSVSDITKVVSLETGELEALKKMAIDKNCNGDLSDEDNTDSIFEVQKNILPDQCVIFKIHFTNQGTGPLTDINIYDDTPAYTTYMGNSAKFSMIPTGMSAGDITAPPDGEQGELTWQLIGSLLAGDRGEVEYSVRVSSD